MTARRVLIYDAVMSGEANPDGPTAAQRTTANPYAAPAHFAERQTSYGPPTLSFWHAIFWVASLAGAGAILGALGGALLGLAVPDYYHAVFGDPQLRPVQVGLGLGLTQGLGVGLVVGCVIALAVAVSRRRRTD